MEKRSEKTDRKISLEINFCSPPPPQRTRGPRERRREAGVSLIPEADWCCLFVAREVINPSGGREGVGMLGATEGTRGVVSLCGVKG